METFIIIVLIISYQIYIYKYFKSEKFLAIKNSIEKYAKDCNDLNDHIEELKQSYINFKQIDYGSANYIDNSKYNFKRPHLKKINNQKHVVNCSLSVCKNAHQQPFKYITKYFNIPENEKTLNEFEEILNNFSAAEQGKVLLKKQRDNIINGIINEIPFIIKIFSKKKLIRKLGFKDIDFSQLYFPKFQFVYTSAGGNSSMRCDIVLNINMLDRFINYLSEKIKFRKSIAGQRALMTSNLREKIKERDNYTCQKCGISIEKEPNLLLEIDHIIPLSKGGLTSENNLQALCWRCNRKKGSKIEKDK